MAAAKKPAAKPATVPPKTTKAAPKPTELGISYSIGTKVNIKNYESVDVHISESEKYDVTGMSVADVEELWKKRYEALTQRLGDIVLLEKQEILGD